MDKFKDLFTESKSFVISWDKSKIVKKESKHYKIKKVG